MAKSQSITLKTQASKAKGKTDEITLVMQGELTLDNAAKVKDFFMASMPKGSQFHVKINQVENIDLGVLQLLKRFTWDAQEQQKKVSISMALTDDQKQLLSRSGFSAFIS